MTSQTRVMDADFAGREELDALVRRAQEGEEAAFAELLSRFESRALLIARSMGASRTDAEDIAQEAFLKIFRYIRSYRSGNSFSAYFYRIVMNASRDHLSRMSPSGQASLDEAGEVEAPPDRSSAYEEVELLRRSLKELPTREREVVILRDMQGLSTWEVARVLRISPITVRRHSSRALARLKVIMRSNTEDER